MTKTTRNLALLGAFSIFVAGCMTLENTQADFWADQAEQIARNCPAASTQAQAARAWAGGTAAESTAPADAASARAAARDELVRNLAQAEVAHKNAYIVNAAANSDALKECLALPTTSAVGNINRQHDIEKLEQWETQCGQRADCLERGRPNSQCDPYACSGLGANGSREFERIHGLQAELCRRGQPIDPATLRSYSDALIRAGQQLRAAQSALSDFDAETSRQTPANESNAVSGTSNAHRAQTAYQEAQRIAAEQCGEGAALQEAPPNPSLPSGEYPQDILNSQPMGLPALLGGPAPLACCSTNPMCAICTGGCPAFCSACNTGC